MVINFFPVLASVRAESLPFLETRTAAQREKAQYRWASLEYFNCVPQERLEPPSYELEERKYSGPYHK